MDDSRGEVERARAEIARQRTMAGGVRVPDKIRPQGHDLLVAALQRFGVRPIDVYELTSREPARTLMNLLVGVSEGSKFVEQYRFRASGWLIEYQTPYHDGGFTTHSAFVSEDGIESLDLRWRLSRPYRVGGGKGRTASVHVPRGLPAPGAWVMDGGSATPDPYVITHVTAYLEETGRLEPGEHGLWKAPPF
jgi:hypothetical protein